MKYYLLMFYLLTCACLVQAQDTLQVRVLLNKLEIAQDTQKINILNQLAQEFRRSHPEKSISFGKPAWEMSQNLGYQRGIAEAASNLAVVHELQAHYLEALDYHLKALRIYENLHDSVSIAMTFSDIALLHYRQEHYPQALRYCHDAQMINPNNDNVAQMSIWTNYGKIYAKINKFDSAFWYLRKALALSHAKKNKEYQSISLNNMGLAYKSQKNYTEALNYFQNALEIVEDLGNPFMKMLDLKHIGHIYMILDNPDQALYYEQKAFVIAKKMNIRDYCKEITAHLSDIYKAKKQYDSAFYYLEKHNSLRDSIYDLDKVRKLAQLEAHYDINKKNDENELLKKETDLKEQTIQQQKLIGLVFGGLLLLLIGTLVALLRISHHRKQNNDLLQSTQAEILRQKNIIEERNSELIMANEKLLTNEKKLLDTNRRLQITEKAIRRKNENILKQKEELERLNNVKDKLFSIIAHDFKSPLHSLKGMLQLLTMGVLTPEEIQSLAIDINEKNEHTLNLIDNLLQWAKSQMQGVEVNPQNIDIEAITDEAIALLSPQAERKETILQNEIMQAAWVYADPDMIKLVIRNLISNAIKFTEKGTISIAVEYQENQIITKVQDTGLGISHENLGKLFGADAHFTTIGTHKEKGTGLGLMLCKNFIEKNRGEIWVESKIGTGSTFYFSLPTNSDMFLDFDI